MIEAGVAGAEIVERDLDADIAKLLQNSFGVIETVHHRGLGDLDLEAERRKASHLQDAEYPLRQLQIGELPGRQVDRNEDVVRPGFGVSYRTGEEGAGQIGDAAGVLGDGNE